MSLKVSVLRFDHLCYGQWFSMVNLSPRLPIKHGFEVMETTAPSHDKTNEESGKVADKRQRFAITEKPDFEIIDDDYYLI